MSQAKFWKKPKETHGGAQAAGKRKVARVILVKQPMHLTFKSSRAKGEWSFHKRGDELEDLVYETAERFNVRIRMYSNVGNHIHLVAQGKKRFLFQNFLRVVAQRVMFLVTGARKGQPQGKFWDQIVHSRVVHWGKDFNRLQDYFFKNDLEGAGVSKEEIKGWREYSQRIWADSA
jgi:REP element-mobilizing transposase RayT